MHSHGAGHYESPDETIARLGGGGAPSSTLGPNAVTSGAGPTVAPGVAAGTGALASLVRGTDNAGVLVLDVGTSPGTGEVVGVTFATPFPSIPNIVLFPQNVSAAAAADLIFVQATVTGGFGINSSSALPAGTYVWSYMVLG